MTDLPLFNRPLHPTPITLLAALVSTVALVLPSLASASGQVYWGSGDGTLMAGGLGGLAEGAAQTLFEGHQEVDGVSLDPVTGKAYWTRYGPGEIVVGGLGGEGEGAPETLFKGQSGPYGVVVDPATGKIYWTDYGSKEVMVGGLGGESEGAPETLFTGQETPEGVTIDPAAGKIYWTDWLPEEIMVGGIGGESEGPAKTLYRGEHAAGIAVDPASGKLYWARNEPNEIMVGDLGGETEGPPERLFVAYSPIGVALDPAAHKIYWTETGTNEVAAGSLGGEGEGAATMLFEQSNLRLLALLSSPVGTGAPVLSGLGTVGQPLSCGTGSWAGDMPESMLYQSPESLAYQWLENGTPIVGASSSTFSPGEAGSYACQSTASNAAGAATQTSAATKVTTTKPSPNPDVTPAQTTSPTLVPIATTPAIQIKLVSRVAGAGKASVALHCTSAACDGKLSLAWVHTKAGKTITTLFSRTRYTLGAGKGRLFVMHLSDEAIKRLKNRQLQVRTRATVNKGATVHRFAPLVLG